MEFNPQQMTIEMWSSKPRSDWVYKPPQGIRATYAPLGITVCEEGQRSQHANRAVAIARLKTMVEEAEVQQELPDMELTKDEVYQTLKNDISHLKNQLQQLQERYDGLKHEYDEMVLIHGADPYTSLPNHERRLRMAHIQYYKSLAGDLVVECGDGYLPFYPGNQTWKSIEGITHGGVCNLIRYIGKYSDDDSD